ncbi:hypothetical protein IFU30_12420 [Plantibacter sp. CFBP 8798]|uniref:hypothetical protein n=1 Tax=Plantibacter sp. CFBP 8798 TaxID=2775268 RepID=UPI00177EDC36|nr:hypothetical protein [Plantibacter sp. CFBP 8798]MBD8467074.1 hypothetical protein [Plantibacter sp. CFBP 8798]
MSVHAFVDALTEDLAVDQNALSATERELLAAVGQEDSRDPRFNFAQSASMKAVGYVRDNLTDLAEPRREKFVKYVSDNFASSYRGAAVQSGCMVPCRLS